MESPIPDSVTVVAPEAAPDDSFVGPEFAGLQSVVTRSSNKLQQNATKCVCTACGDTKDPTFDKLYAHPILVVLVCNRCHVFYHMGDFTQDAEGYDEQCRWCGQGGKLFMCDSPGCTYSFCKNCTERNFTVSRTKEILEADRWCCFSCDDSQLTGLVEQCKNFVNFTESTFKQPDRLNEPQLNVPISMTAKNEQIDSLLAPLETSSNGLGDNLADFLPTTKRTVSPITIRRDNKKYVVETKSASCDEAVSQSHISNTQSDPEVATKRGRTDSAEMFSNASLEEDVNNVENMDSNVGSSRAAGSSQSDFDQPKSTECKIKQSATLDTNGAIDTDLVSPNGIQGDINESPPNDPNRGPQPVSKLFPRPKNVGRRTKSNRAVDCQSDDDYDVDRKEIKSQRMRGLSEKLEKGEKLFAQYTDFLRDLISEKCSSSSTTCQSPSQYAKFRSAKSIFHHVKRSSKQLVKMEHYLRTTKAKLGTYRDAPKSTRSSNEDSTELASPEFAEIEDTPKKSRSPIDGNGNVEPFLTPLDDTEIASQRRAEIEDTPKKSRSPIDGNGNVEPFLTLLDDIKLVSMKPVVVLKRLTEEELRWWTNCDVSSSLDTDLSEISLDSDSSKRPLREEMDLTDAPEILNDEDSETDTKSKTSKSVKKTRTRIKRNASTSTSSSSLDLSDSEYSSSSVDLDSDDMDMVQSSSGQDTDNADSNTIAKNLLLQRIANTGNDGSDSDVDDLIEKNNADKEKARSAVNKTAGIAKPSDNARREKKKRFQHPLLAFNLNGNESRTNRDLAKPKQKRKTSHDKDGARPKKVKRDLSSDDSSTDSDSSSDSTAVMNLSRKGDAAKRRRIDSDSSVEIQPKIEKPFDSDEAENWNPNPHLKRATSAKTQPTIAKSPNKMGRKNIRKVLDDAEISQSTQKAKREEIERRKRLMRLSDAEEVMDVITIDDDTSEKIVKKVTMPLTLSKDPHIEIDPEMVKFLKPHQKEGIKFIWNNLIEKVAFAETGKGNGCILSHCMGLGKTLQTISFLHAVLLSEHLKYLNTALVLCPFITVNNWVAEFDKWLPAAVRNLYVRDLDSLKSEHERMARLQEWKTTGGVLIVGYSLFRSLLRVKKKADAVTNPIWKELLLGPDILVCDEGHILKNASTALAGFVGQVKTRRKLILTGTPLQNNMVEYHCMVSLVKPSLLGDLKEFKNRFVNPIENGQHVDSTARDVRLMKKRAHVLHELLAGCVQRKDYTYLKDHLKPKYEYTLKVRLSDLQIRLYKRYLSLKHTGDLKAHKTCLFRDFNKLLLIVCHPRCLVMHKEMHTKALVENDDEEDDDDGGGGWSSDDSIIQVYDDDEEIPEPVIPNPETLEDIHALSRRKLRLFIKSKSGKETAVKSKKKLIGMAEKYLDENFCKTREFEESLKGKSVPELKALITQHGGSFVGCSEKIDLVNLLKSLMITETVADAEWFENIMPSQEKLYYANDHGAKIVLMLKILQGANRLDEKVVLFSQSLLSLDLIEQVLHSDSKPDAARETRGNSTKWVKNKDYYRIDGSIPSNVRSKIIDDFNDKKNDRGRFLLVSTRSGSMGVNLVGASRAIVFDASWNPSNDIQSIFRIYRFGQTKPCFIYRLVAQGTMEEKVYERQVVKRSLSFRVVDEQQINRHFRAADINELYAFKPDMTKRKKDAVPECAPPRDALLASIINSTDLVVSYHEPDTLLDHQVAEELSAADRKAAWEEFARDQPSTFETHLETMPRKAMERLKSLGLNLLKSIDGNVSQIQDKPLDKMITQRRMECRGASTEDVTMYALNYKLNNHILRRRQENLKRAVKPYLDTVEMAIRDRFLHSNSGYPQVTVAGASGSSLAGVIPNGNPQQNRRNPHAATTSIPNLFPRYQSNYRGQSNPTTASQRGVGTNGTFRPQRGVGPRTYQPRASTPRTDYRPRGRRRSTNVRGYAPGINQPRGTVPRPAFAPNQNPARGGFRPRQHGPEDLRFLDPTRRPPYRVPTPTRFPPYGKKS